MSLELIIGCMFSGKTTELINRVNKLKSIDKNVLIINSKLDTRYSINNIHTHNNNYISCISINNMNEIYNYINNYEYIIIDEAQFITNLYNIVKDLIDNKNKKVIIAGLICDSDRRHFGEIYLLYPLADKINHLKSFCHYCKNGTIGIFTKKIIDEVDNQISIGSSDKYVAVCRKCYLR